MAPQPTARPEAPTGCLVGEEPARGGELRVETILQGAFERPLAMVHVPNEESTWYVVGQRGVIWRVTPDDASARIDIALDWRGRTVDPIATGSHEAGLWGLALHPNYPADARAFVTAALPDERGCPTVVVEELLVNGDGSFDPIPNRLLFEIRTRCTFVDGIAQSIHHGGTLQFEPGTGRLVYGLGDLNRPSRAADPDAPEGSLLWLDVDATLDGDDPALPGLFVPGGVLAWGLRNPWKWSFDRATGDIWVGDVGRDRREEVDRIAVGENHGWPSWEGDLCIREDCEEEPHHPPVFTYDHGAGCSVTGGYVYRGSAIPDLFGAYLLADWCSGLVWALFPTDQGSGEAEPVAGLVADLARPIASFAEDADGELYLLDHDGSVLRIRHFQRHDRPAFPARLSETGCVDRQDPTRPSDHLIPYELNVPFWSDGAAKRRWMSIPEGARVEVDDEGGFVFPVGSVLMKEFTLGGERVETRLFARHDDGWQGYSYAWEDGDATLVDAFGARRVLDDAADEWIFPARRECPRCHTAIAGRTLGPEIAQLNRSDGHGVDNQLDALVTAGVLDPTRLAELDAAFPRSDAPTSEADLDDAARAYLHVNCAMCHRRGGRTLIDMDLRADTPLGDTGLCGVPATRTFPDVRDPFRVAPGDPESSVVWQRLVHPADRRMPPLASLVVDETGADLIERWILSLSECP